MFVKKKMSVYVYCHEQYNVFKNAIDDRYRLHVIVASDSTIYISFTIEERKIQLKDLKSGQFRPLNI